MNLVNDAKLANLCKKAAKQRLMTRSVEGSLYITDGKFMVKMPHKALPTMPKIHTFLLGTFLGDWHLYGGNCIIDRGKVSEYTGNTSQIIPGADKLNGASVTGLTYEYPNATRPLRVVWTAGNDEPTLIDSNYLQVLEDAQTGAQALTGSPAQIIVYGDRDSDWAVIIMPVRLSPDGMNDLKNAFMPMGVR